MHAAKGARHRCKHTPRRKQGRPNAIPEFYLPNPKQQQGVKGTQKTEGAQPAQYACIPKRLNKWEVTAPSAMAQQMEFLNWSRNEILSLRKKKRKPRPERVSYGLVRTKLQLNHASIHHTVCAQTLRSNSANSQEHRNKQSRSKSGNKIIELEKERFQRKFKNSLPCAKQRHSSIKSKKLH